MNGKGGLTNFMSMEQVYTHRDVLTAARERINYIFDNFERIIVSISGGKDSTTTCYLALQEAHKRGRKIGIFFLDEEVDYQSTIEQVKYLMTLYPENTIPMWYQIEFKLTNATSLNEGQLICWEAGKHNVWMRSKESIAIQHKPWDAKSETVRNKNKGFGFYDVLENFQRYQNGAAFLVGVRATESMNRWRAVSKNPGFKDCYWCTKSKGNSVSFYPLYDWNFSDVWKFIYDEKLRYNKIYDLQWKQGVPMSEMRISSLIHEKSFKAIVELPAFEPKTYDRLLKRIDGIQVAQLYGKDNKMLKCRKLPKNYSTWHDYREFLIETYPDVSKKDIFVRRYSRQLENEYVARQQCRQLILNDYENDLPVDNKPDPREATLEKWRKLL
jgi:predicted phosphoadenosine phosphosulfate sulfurtransferase